ncbi:hypothetical protein SAMN06265360_1109 [Haloechinothrix alba]|uniref:Uncharacterized protein n=1 Tax=Haloechinothrix alba TaxID=664784 RepID=A0A238X9H9_9PSEU|nr:hypothetical protein [Haloechinothrix alba]SNR55705.1 hypothetical protein SAMN06265360_1109 [Haloechinothrix alba]
MTDPSDAGIPTEQLTAVSGALDLLDRHAELNHRYRKLITESQRELATDRVRLTLARGIAKRLIVLIRAAGPQLRAELDEREQRVLDEALAHAEELAYNTNNPGQSPREPGQASG